MAAVKDALDPSWINAPSGVGPSYDAEELRRLQGYQLAAGATAGSSRTGVLNPRDLALSLSGSNVLVGAGGAVIGTAKGAYVCGVAAVTTIGALVAADVTNPRRDRVVLEILDPDNGGTAGRKAQLRIIDGTPNASAATGGGFPAAPTSPFIDLGYADMPKAGAGSPSLTITAPITAMAGAPIPVQSLAERDALPKWNGLQVQRLDLAGKNLQTYSGADFYPQQLDPLPNVNFASSGGFEVSLNGGRKYVAGQVRFTRTVTGGAFSCPAGSYTSLGNVVPAGARGAGTGFPIYVSAVVVNGPYMKGTVAIGGNEGAQVSFRPDTTFSWTVGAFIDITFGYFL